MNIYLRCSKCHFKQKLPRQNLYGDSKCPKCDSIKIDMTFGGKPSWWTEEDEKNAGK